MNILAIPAESFYSGENWNWPSRLLNPASKLRWIGNYVTPDDLRELKRLDYLAQKPLKYLIAFEYDQSFDIQGFRRLDNLSGLVDLSPFCDSCGESTCFGLINQFVTEHELERGLECAARVSEDFGLLPARDGHCIYYEQLDGRRCKIHDIKPLWCRMYICDHMWQRARKVIGC